MAEYEWDPLSPQEAAAVFAPLGIPWWVAGGHAIDLFVGRETRAHGDIDVAVLRRDVDGLRALSDAWELDIAHDGTLTPWDGRALQDAEHQFWVRRPGATAWSFEILLEYPDGDMWCYRRDRRITMPLGDVGLITADGIPFLRPAITLLYKAGSSTLARNEADFDVMLPVLPPADRAWLHAALETAHAGHRWSERLR